MSALYYREPSEPGADDDILAEVVDGTIRRRIEISHGATRCTGSDVADYVWPISEQEFNQAWLRHCL